MHTWVLYGAAIWLTVLVGVCVTLIVRSQGTPRRVVLVDLVALLLVAILILYSTAEEVAFYLDAALVLALLSFAGSLAAARYHDRGDVLGDE